MNWIDVVDGSFVVQLLAGGVALGVPLAAAALGETFAQRSGVLNIGVEGIMLFGGFVGFIVAVQTGDDRWLGVAAGLAVGVALGLLFAVITVTLGADQIVVGLALVLLATGAAIYLNRLLFSVTLVVPNLRPFDVIPIPVLSDLPVVGPILFEHDVLTYFILLLVPVSAGILFRTSFGPRVTAVGEAPDAADSAGVKVNGVRYVCVLIGGALAGLAGV